MACVAQINYNLGASSGYTLPANCTGNIVVLRDGANYATIPVTTNASGLAAGVYTDNSPGTSHAYTFSLQKSGCFAACNVPDSVVNWVATGVAPPPPPPPASGNCVYTATVLTIGNTLQVTLGDGAVAGTYTVDFGAPVGIRTFVAAGPGVYNVPSIPLGGYCIRISSPTCVVTASGDIFSPPPPACATCSPPRACITVVSTATCTAQLAVVTEQGSSAYPVPTNKTFNSALQQIRFTVSGTPGACYKINGVGTINGVAYSNIGATSFAIGAGGTSVFTTTFGQTKQYDVTWSIVPGDTVTAVGIPPGVTPCVATIVAPSTVNQLRGSTTMELVGSQTFNSASFSVQSPVGVPLPDTATFSLTANGGPFGGNAGTCSGGTSAPGLAVNSDEPGAGTPGVWSIVNSGPYSVGTTFCWKLVSTDGEHQVSLVNFQKTFTF